MDKGPLSVMQGNSELTELFDLEPTEELMERFACALLQSYTCTHNTFSPVQQVNIMLIDSASWNEKSAFELYAACPCLAHHLA